MEIHQKLNLPTILSSTSPLFFTHLLSLPVLEALHALEVKVKGEDSVE